MTLQQVALLQEFAVEKEKSCPKKTEKAFKIQKLSFNKKQQTHFKNWEYSSENKGFQINIALPAMALPDRLLLLGLFPLSSRAF